MLEIHKSGVKIIGEKTCYAKVMIVNGTDKVALSIPFFVGFKDVFVDFHSLVILFKLYGVGKTNCVSVQEDKMSQKLIYTGVAV